MRYHFSGIAGAGMNPLARLLRARGHIVQGSDRAFDRGQHAEVAAGLRGLGIAIVPHDGSAVTPDLDRVVYSTAVEADTPEMRAARGHGLSLVPRPALLAEVVRPEGMVIPMSPKTFPTQNKEEQKSLVNRLIGRIRSL